MVTKFYYKNVDAPMPNNPNHIGATVILKCKGKILFEKRVDCSRWSLIGGGLELSESVEECAMREVYEETGIKILESDLKLVKIHSDPSRIAQYPDGNIRRIVSVLFEVVLDDYEELKCSEESIELKWLSESEIGKIDIVETHDHIIKEYFLNI